MKASAKNIALGDVVTTRRPEKAYYSGYAGNPLCFFTEADRGIVGAVKVPYVAKTYAHGDYFVCVDFEKYGDVWRVGLDYADIVKLDEPWPRTYRSSCREVEAALRAACDYDSYEDAIKTFCEPFKSALERLKAALDEEMPRHATNRCDCYVAVERYRRVVREAFRKG